MMSLAIAQELGAGSVLMLTVIAHQEDACMYSKPITYWNDQLAAICGFGSWDTLDRARARCVAAGWLHYEAGAKGRPGRYWVTIPERFEAIPDHCSSENGNRYDVDSTGNIPPQNTGANAEENAGENPLPPMELRSIRGSCTGESADHSPLSLSQDDRERDALARHALNGHNVPAGGDWTRRWLAIARDYGRAESLDDQLACLGWAIIDARRRGRQVGFPENIIAEAGEWAQRRATAARIDRKGADGGSAPPAPNSPLWGIAAQAAMIAKPTPPPAQQPAKEEP